MAVLANILQGLSLIIGLVLIGVVASQSEKSEGLTGILAGGGGGGGKVGKAAHLDKAAQYSAYGWLILTAVAAWMKHAFG